MGGTIFAPASGSVRSGVCVIRLSGEAVREVLTAMAGAIPTARRMSLRTLRDPRTNTALDRALVVFFPAPHSFSGEDQAELHIHGGPAVRRAVLAALSAFPGCRLAEPGEFTRRAFANGRMDLTEVEGLADLIDAETEAQRRQALRLLENGLGTRAEEWRRQLIQALALVEASLDFADEGDVPAGLEAQARVVADAVRTEIGALLLDDRRGERLRDGLSVAIAGPPNAGKSTLLNALARREVAITSPIAGTTRDIIEVRLDLDGFPVLLADTAGMRDSGDQIEQEGVARARRRLADSDVVLWLVPADDCSPSTLPPQENSAVRQIRVLTKIDLLGSAPYRNEAFQPDVSISVTRGDGVADLIDLLTEMARELCGAGDALVTRERHRIALRDCDAALARTQDQKLPELLAEDLRLAARAMGRISGRVDVEDVLDQLFGAFCIGK